MSDGKLWTVQDREGNPIYLTRERATAFFKHILQKGDPS